MAFTSPSDKNLITIYAAGGSGYNLAKDFLERFKNTSFIKDVVQVYFVDTSTSNNNNYNTEDNTIVLGSGEGSGKKRAKNASEIRDEMPTLFRKFKPGVFNILLGGASGGSGSTIINEMFRELAIRKANTVSMLVGSRASRSEIENTDKTFQSFARLANRYEYPAVVHYRENTPGSTRSVVNANLVTNLSLLCLILSGRDDKMDISDLSHFVNYPEVTSFTPGVVGLEVFTGKLNLKPHEVLYSVATLAIKDQNTDVDPLPEYQVAGYIQDEFSDVFGDVHSIHWSTLGNSFGPIMRSLTEQVEIFKEQSKKHTQENLDRGASTEEDDDILV